MNSWTRYLFCTYFRRATQVLKCRIKHIWNDSMMTSTKSDTNVFTVSEFNLCIEFLPSANKEMTLVFLPSLRPFFRPSTAWPSHLGSFRASADKPQIGFSLGFVDEWDIIWLTFASTVSWYMIGGIVSAHLQQNHIIKSSSNPMVELIVLLDRDFGPFQSCLPFVYLICCSFTKLRLPCWAMMYCLGVR